MAPCSEPYTLILRCVQALPGGDIKQLPLELSNFLGALPPPRSLTGSQVPHGSASVEQSTDRQQHCASMLHGCSSLHGCTQACVQL